MTCVAQRSQPNKLQWAAYQCNSVTLGTFIDADQSSVPLVATDYWYMSCEYVHNYEDFVTPGQCNTNYDYPGALHWFLLHQKLKSPLMKTAWCHRGSESKSSVIHSHKNYPRIPISQNALWFRLCLCVVVTWKWKMPVYPRAKPCPWGTTRWRRSSLRVREAMAASSQQSPADTPHTLLLPGIVLRGNL